MFPQWFSLFNNVEEILSLLEHPETILQENGRGVVSLICHQELQFIAKRSKIQERRRWAQFTSLYRKGEGARALGNLARLHALGLPVPEPVLVLEKKIFGVTIVSWSLYHYLEGKPCTCAEVPQLAKILRHMHRHGWVHRDPHVKNFLVNDGKISIIDCARARPWKSRYAQMYDVVLLNNCCPGSLQYYGITETSWIYRLAKKHNNFIKFWRRTKRRLRPHAYQSRG